MCAVDVPAFIIQAPPILLLSGRPGDAAVAPGTAIVTCRRTLARVLSLSRVEHRSKLRLDALAVLLELGERRFTRGAIGDFRLA